MCEGVVEIIEVQVDALAMAATLLECIGRGSTPDLPVVEEAHVKALLKKTKPSQKILQTLYHKLCFTMISYDIM